MFFISFFAACSLAALATEAADISPASESRYISNPRQLIYDGKRSGEGYFRSDGKRLVFQAEREEGNPFYQIYVLDFLSGDIVRVSPGVGKTTCAFFQPGTTRLLFASTHHDPDAQAKQKAELEFRASGKQRRYSWDYDPTFDIFSSEQDGSKMQRLTEAQGYDAEGSYSPDGRKIVFCSTRAAYPSGQLSTEDQARLEREPSYFGDIYVMNADGSDQRRLTATRGYDGGPFFSPDGERIIWRRFDEQGINAEVYTMKSDGSDVRRLTDFKSMSWAPFYHPSGKYVVFTSNKLGFDNFELFIVDVQGTREPVRVTFTDGFDGLPVFSPDGTKLCWTSNRTPDKKSQLFLADWKHEVALSALEAAQSRPRESADRSNAGAGSAHDDANASTPPSSPEITAGDLRADVDWLADQRREGRMTGSPGARSTAEWLAAYFRGNGVKPFADDFFEPFDFNAGEKLIPDKNALSVNGTAFALETDFRPLSFSDSGEVEGEVVFAGYGLSVPAADEAAGAAGAPYNSYDGVEVKDKIALILRYVPEKRGARPPRPAQSLRGIALQGDARSGAWCQSRPLRDRSKFTASR